MSIAISPLVLFCLDALDEAPFVVIGTILFVAVPVRVMKSDLLGSTTQVSKDQISTFSSLVTLAAQRLEMDPPTVFVVNSPFYNAISFGIFGTRVVALNSALVENLTSDELLFFIGHKCMHIRARHTRWLLLTSRLLRITPPFHCF